MALRNKSFGNAQEFVWAAESNEYATRESSSTVKLFKGFKEIKSFKPELGAEGNLDLCLSVLLVTCFLSNRNLWRELARGEVCQQINIL